MWDKSSLHPVGSLLDSLIYSECVEGNIIKGIMQKLESLKGVMDLED